MEPKRVAGKKSYERTAEQLLEWIRQNGIKPGQRLESVEQLGKRFQVGRSTIREALSYLRAKGLVEIRQGDGTFATAPEAVRPGAGAASESGFLPLPALESDSNGAHHPAAGEEALLSRQEVLEFFEMRKIVESGVAALAASKRTEEDLQAMRDALDTMRLAAGGDNLGEAADAEFHLAIARAAQNRILFQTMSRISDTLRTTMRESRRLWLFAEDTTLERLHKEHDALYSAIEEQNPPLAQQLMLAHLHKVERLLLQSLTPD